MKSRKLFEIPTPENKEIILKEKNAPKIFFEFLEAYGYVPKKIKLIPGADHFFVLHEMYRDYWKIELDPTWVDLNREIKKKLDRIDILRASFIDAVLVKGRFK